MQERLENSSFCRNVLILSIFSAAFSLGYAFTCLNPLVPVIKDLYNETYYSRHGEPLSESLWIPLLSLTMSILIVGGFSGAVTVRFILKALSRKSCMILAHAIQITGVLIIAVGAGVLGSYEAFIIGRFFVGYAVGLSMNTIPVVIAEMSTHWKQGLYQSLTGVFIIAGNICGAIFAHPKLLGSAKLWPGVVSLSCLPSLIYLCCAYWIPNTPYLVLRGANRRQSIDILRRLRTGSEVKIMEEIETMESEQLGGRKASTKDDDAVIEEKEPYVNFIGIWRKPQYRKQFLTVVMIYVGAMSGGVNHVVFFSDQIFLSAGISKDHVTYVTIGVFAVQALVAFIGMRLMTVYGPRKLLLGAQVVIVLSHIITTASLATAHLSLAAGYVSIVGILLTLNGYAGGPNLAMYALAGEITTEPSRQTVFNYGGGCLWVAAWLTGFIPPYLDSILGPYSFLVWAVGATGSTILFYFFVPETKEKSVEEIQQFFK